MPASALRATVGSLPLRPGVYLFKDENGRVLYVGKAASLRSRVRSYFGSDLTPKLQKMMERTADLEYIVTDSEAEALILECTLIKRHRPRYNVRLKDDKAYPYLKINLNEPWARVYITRRIEDDGARYFGPFASAGSVRRTMDLVKKLFPYRSCTRVITGHDPRPCLDYYIHRCIAPCIGACTREEYDGVLQQVVLFLEGRQEQVARQLRGQMLEASERLEFERAAVLRDQIRAVERVVEHQKVSSPVRGDQDVIAFARGQDETCVQVFFIRGGKVIGREHFMLEGTQDEPPEAVMAGFLLQFYDTAPSVPPLLLLQHGLPDPAVLSQWLAERRQGPVRLEVPQRGEKRKLVELVADNAEQVLQQLRVRWLADRDKTLAAVEELQEQLNLPALPKRIECYDISNIQGTSSVGSMVVFENGQPKPAHYRRFRIKTVAGANDFASHQEVLRRRFRHAASVEQYRQAVEGEGGSGKGEGETLSTLYPDAESKGGRGSLPPSPSTLHPGGEGRRGDAAWATLPDLIIIDGGKGQLSAALAILEELGLNWLPTVGLAKEREEIFMPDMSESILLPRNSQSLYLVQRIRDEAHRFAITYHRQLRDRRAMESGLDAVPGIGPKRKMMLLRRFGTLQGIRDASEEELAAVVGMTRTLARVVQSSL